jgi:hypothetical protein
MFGMFAGGAKGVPTSGTSCPQSHPLLAQPVPSGWKCDACHRNFEPNTTSHGCRTCDVDVCDACSRRQCPRRHMMLSIPVAGQWQCNVCQRVSTGPCVGCNTCDYHLCAHCANQPPPMYDSRRREEQIPPPAAQPYQAAVPPPGGLALRAAFVGANPSTALSCPKGHGLPSAAVPSAWSCDGCKRDFPPGSKSAACRTCDIDMCSTCTDQPGCRNRHLLMPHPTPYPWRCDGCSREYPAGPLSHGCSTCDFDLCETCFRPAGGSQTGSAPVAVATALTSQPSQPPQPPGVYRAPTFPTPDASTSGTNWTPGAVPRPTTVQSSGPTFASPTVPPAAIVTKRKCQRGHDLVHQRYTVAWGCDACRGDYAPGAAGVGCRQCDVDFCEKCLRLGGCPTGHALVQQQVPSEWNCDRCGGHNVRSAPSYGCRQCDYDVCKRCFEANVTSATNAAAAAPPSVAPPAVKPATPTQAAPTAHAPITPASFTCPQGHQLGPHAHDRKWSCTVCITDQPAQGISQGCGRCPIPFDACAQCCKRSIKCRAGHALVQQFVPGDWNCNVCHRHCTIAEQSRACRTCDYDCCSQCFERMVHSAESAPIPDPSYAAQTPAPSFAAPFAAPTPTPQVPVAVTPTLVTSVPSQQTVSGGRCKALFIGINYKGKHGELRGCINDVITMRNVARATAFDLRDGANCRVLVDDERFPHVHGLPTKRNIMESLRWLAEDARPGDNLLFHYSGHGSQLRDQDGDEADGYDEALVPLDYEHMGLVRDDDIFAILCRDLPKGVRLTCIADCCHAGSVMDLEYQWRWRGETFMPAPPHKKKARAGNQPAVLSRDFTIVSKKHTKADVLLFSGCKDEQTSADVTDVNTFKHDYHGPGAAGGACTNAIAEILSSATVSGSSVPMGRLLEMMQRNLKMRQYTQVPQLSASVKIDMHRPFSFFGALA